MVTGEFGMNVPIFYYDLLSPYSCLAAFRIEKVLPVTALWQPVWLAPVFAASGRQLPSFEEANARRADIVRRAAHYGMPDWHWPPGFEPATEAEHARWQAPNTLALMRLATFAHQARVGESFARGVFGLAFGEGRDVTTIDDAVIRVASDCGLRAEEARAATTDPDIKQALRAATEQAIERGVTGVPTVAVSDQLFWGDDRLEEAAAVAGAPA